MNNFPPETDYPREVKAILEFLNCTIRTEKVAYMSAPITSGKRIIEVHSNGSKQNSVKSQSYNIEQVKEANIKHAKEISKKLRDRIGGILIDPTLVGDIEDWKQNDYHFAWAEIIKKYVKTAFFVDDWNYSKGCSYEFLVSKQIEIETFDENLQPLSVSEGIELIQNAIKDHNLHNLPTDFQQSVLDELCKLEVKQSKIFL